jgi:hypothetical protein
MKPVSYVIRLEAWSARANGRTMLGAHACFYRERIDLFALFFTKLVLSFG